VKSTVLYDFHNKEREFPFAEINYLRIGGAVLFKTAPIFRGVRKIAKKDY
jgi:hypothetical protein